MLNCSGDPTADAQEGNVDVVVDEGAREVVVRKNQRTIDGVITYVAGSVQVVPVTAAGLTVSVPRTWRLGRAAVVAAKREMRVMTEYILVTKVTFEPENYIQ